MPASAASSTAHTPALAADCQQNACVVPGATVAAVPATRNRCAFQLKNCNETPRLPTAALAASSHITETSTTRVSPLTVYEKSAPTAGSGGKRSSWYGGTVTRAPPRLNRDFLPDDARHRRVCNRGRIRKQREHATGRHDQRPVEQ